MCNITKSFDSEATETCSEQEAELNNRIFSVESDEELSAKPAGNIPKVRLRWVILVA